MTTGGFYKHFASKDALIAEAFHYAFEQSTASWQRVLKREQDDARLRSGAIVRHYFQKRPPAGAANKVAPPSRGDTERGAYTELRMGIRRHNAQCNQKKIGSKFFVFNPGGDCLMQINVA